MAHVVGVDEPPEVLHRWARTLSLFIGAMYRRDHAREAHRAMTEMTEALSRATAPASFPRQTPEDRARTTATWAMNLFGGLETTSSLLASTVMDVLGERCGTRCASGGPARRRRSWSGRCDDGRRCGTLGASWRTTRNSPVRGCARGISSSSA